MLSIVTDWEGPWVLNDFAYEICRELFPDGFFEKLSSYDDYLAYEVQKPDYNPGDTLRLIAPFLVARNINSEWMKKVAKPVYLKDASVSSKSLSRFNIIVASTAYEQFLEVSCAKLGLKFKGTKFIPEKYSMDSNERSFLLGSIEKVIKADFDWLDLFFWEELQGFKTSGRIIAELKVMGGKRKMEVAVEEGAKISIGDSISDVDMLEFTAKKGLAIAFNGNRFALEKANLAIISDTALSISTAIHVYALDGIDGVKKLCGNNGFYWLPDMTKDEFDLVVNRSESYRRRMRGIAGKLG
ncbi:MAG: hypothetical protein DSY33_01900 [Archaeoglobus sp.]|nr:MAG: hypothetical protein DSY33_01900 [Archaeoglobus sp.]